MEACEKVGLKANCAEFYKEQFATAGFVNVVEKKFVWPTNRWPKNKKLKEIGKLCIFVISCFAEIDGRCVAT
jgi:hypothetical protein